MEHIVARAGRPPDVEERAQILSSLARQRVIERQHPSAARTANRGIERGELGATVVAALAGA
jgi:hypothetical protein